MRPILIACWPSLMTAYVVAQRAARCDAASHNDTAFDDSGGNASNQAAVPKAARAARRCRKHHPTSPLPPRSVEALPPSHSESKDKGEWRIGEQNSRRFGVLSSLFQST